MALSSTSDLQRVADAARSPEWDIHVAGTEIVAHRDSGVEGLPWSMVARRGGKGMKVSFYQPGDDITIEGVLVGEISGPARDMGRQLRGLLEDADISAPE